MYTISKIYVTTKELIHYKLMMRCVMNTKACEYIVAIAEKKNLSAAAASLGTVSYTHLPFSRSSIHSETVLPELNFLSFCKAGEGSGVGLR